MTADSQVNCKNCLKSTGLHEFVGYFVWFCLNALYQIKKCLNFDGLSEQEKIGQALPYELIYMYIIYEALSSHTAGQSFSTPHAPWSWFRSSGQSTGLEPIPGGLCSTPLYSANKISIADLLTLEIVE